MKHGKTFALLAVGILFFGTVTATSSFTDYEYMTAAEMCAFLPAGTSFLRPNSCNNWVKCAVELGMEHDEGICASGLYYDKDLGICTYENEVKCPYTNIEANINSCANVDDNIFLPDPNSCSGYIYCKAHTEVYGNCPTDLVFNPTTQSCVYKTDYKCPEIDNRTVTPVCRSFQDLTRFADKNECNKYHVCMNGQLIDHECELNMAYDHVKGQCVDIENTVCYPTAVLPDPENQFCLNATGQPRFGYFADDESCSYYYVCARPINGKHDTEPKHLRCNAGQYFDAEKLSCRDRLNVKCTLDRCSGSDLGYVNVAGDCQKYARCSNGISVGHGACPADYYFDERVQGCTQTNHKYIACSS